LKTQTRAPTVARRTERIVKRFSNGLRLVLDPADRGVGLAIRRDGFELNEIDFVMSSLRPGQHVVDAGAHAGYYAIHMAASVGASGKVYAFEPYGPSASCLEASVRENGFDERVVVERVALGEARRDGSLVLGRASWNPGGAFVGPAEYVPARGERSDPVRIMPLDGYPLHRPIAFIKLDVEGAEPLVVAGAQRLLAADRPAILSELDGFNLQRVAGISPGEYIGRMAALGYRCRLLGAGVPTEEIRDWSVSPTVSVVFSHEFHPV
jgi:FkbM family methyltransferase